MEKGSVESTHKVPTSHYRTKHCHSFIEKGSVESTHKVPTSHYRTKHCHMHSFITHHHVHSRSELQRTHNMQTHAGGELRNSQNKRMRQDPYMNSGERAPADMGGEPPDGRAKAGNEHRVGIE